MGMFLLLQNIQCRRPASPAKNKTFTCNTSRIAGCEQCFRLMKYKLDATASDRRHCTKPFYFHAQEGSSLLLQHSGVSLERATSSVK